MCGMPHDSVNAQLATKFAENRRLKAEVESLKADKARKRWLIEKANIPFLKFLSGYESMADEQIDAAMEGDK